MATTQTTTKPEPIRMGDKPAAPPPDPVIKTVAVQWQSNGGNTGNLWREAFIVLPAEIKNVQALNDAAPSLWRNVMGSPQSALRKRDHVVFESHDASWGAEARVAFADRSRVVLCGVRHYSIPKIEIGLFEDEHYRVVPHLGGYQVQRKLDDVPMGSSTYTSPEAARMALLNLYPTRAA